MLSFAIIGFIWQLVYSPTQGLINNIIGDPANGGHVIDWLGNPKLNLWAVLSPSAGGTPATSWCCTSPA